MPARRRQAKPRRPRVTPEAIAAYEAGDFVILHRHLGLKPWEASPLAPASLDEPSPWPAGSGGAISWPKALALKAELEIKK